MFGVRPATRSFTLPIGPIRLKESLFWVLILAWTAVLPLQACPAWAAGKTDEYARLVAKGIDLHMANRFKEASNAFEKAAALDPERPVAHLNQCANLGYWAQSLPPSSKTKIKDLVDRSNRHCYMALEKLVQDNAAEGTPLWNESLATIYENLGFNNRLTGNATRAKAYLEKSLEYEQRSNVMRALILIKEENKSFPKP